MPINPLDTIGTTSDIIVACAPDKLDDTGSNPFLVGILETAVTVGRNSKDPTAGHAPSIPGKDGWENYRKR